MARKEQAGANSVAATTMAGKWLAKLKKLKGTTYDEAWNEMIANAITQEVDYWRACDVFMFVDGSALEHHSQRAPSCEWLVVPPQYVAGRRNFFQWRLAGTKPPQLAPEGYPEASFLDTQSAVKLLGISMRKLQLLCREGRLRNTWGKDFARGKFYLNELHHFLKQHPMPREV